MSTSDRPGPSPKAHTRSPASPARQAANPLSRLSSPLVQQVLRSPGQPVVTGPRTLLESRFGHDFSQVRIHADTTAAESARAVSARAYTVGPHVVFGAGQYQPHTRSGLHLLAHEMAHVVQQGGRPPSLQARLEVTQPGDASEREAERAAEAVLQDCPAPPLSQASAQLARWKIEDNTATVNSEEDRLGQLPGKVQSNPLNWVGIKPLAMKTADYATPPADFQTHYEKYLQIGDTFDLSNLKATSGSSLRINFHPSAGNQALVSAKRFYPGTKQIKADPLGEIEKASGEGQTPLAEAIMFGHSGSDQMTDGASCILAPTGLKPDEPAPTYDRAKAGKFPRRCWFTTNAQVRAAGCTSVSFGNAFAGVFLRKGGSQVFVTLRTMSPSCSHKYRPPGGDLKTCGATIDALEFWAADGDVHNNLEHGPFTNAADFEASPFWGVVSGKL
ncbi:MAG TPA: DUF4157 domain-containing protein [Thermoanaerobaculia bacterium]|nr:DUF4157 domain-containing protein [Thermoanaerobaculia bacterium]